MFLRYHWQTNCNWLDFSDDGDILIFSSHLRLGLSNVLVLWGFPTKNIHAFFYFPMRATFSAHVTLLELLTLILSDVILKQPLLNSNKTQQHKTYRGIKYVISCKHVMCWVKKKIWTGLPQIWSILFQCYILQFILLHHISSFKL